MMYKQCVVSVKPLFSDSVSEERKSYTGRTKDGVLRRYVDVKCPICGMVRSVIQYNIKKEYTGICSACRSSDNISYIDDSGQRVYRIRNKQGHICEFVDIICPICKKTRKVSKYVIKKSNFTKLCSLCHCKIPKQKGEKSPYWKGGKYITVTCPSCHISRRLLKSNRKSDFIGICIQCSGKNRRLTDISYIDYDTGKKVKRVRDKIGHIQHIVDVICSDCGISHVVSLQYSKKSNFTGLCTSCCGKRSINSKKLIPLTEEQEKEIIDLYESMNTIIQIHIKINLPTLLISQTLKKHGIEIRDSQNKVQFNEETKNEIKNKYINGDTFESLSNEYRCSCMKIKKIIRDDYISKENKKFKKNGNREMKLPCTEDEIKDMFVNKKMSLYKIGKLCDTGGGTIKKRLLKNNVSVDTKKPERKKLPYTDEEICNMYRSTTHDSRSLSEICDCSTGTIMGILKRNKIKVKRMPNEDTRPERIIFEKLMNKNIIFKRHSHIKITDGVIVRNKLENTGYPHKFDIVINSIKTAIEIQGCFWHGCRECFPEDKTKIQKEIFERIRPKDEMLKKFVRINGWKLIELWEHDINKNEPYIDSIIEEIYKECINSPEMREDVFSLGDENEEDW